MPVNDLIDIIRASSIANTFFHFTDGRNIDAIAKDGLLSMDALRKRGTATVPGGNQWSLDADITRGLDRYVHLCMRNSHPMEYRASKEGQIANVHWLKIDPTVILIPGVLMTTVVSNQSDSRLISPEDAIPDLDLEVLYTRTEWKNAEIKERLNLASKYEILVPDHVPLDYIRF